VSVAASGQSVMTDSRGRFALDNTPVGSNRLQFDNGARGSVNVDTQRGMELNVAVALSGPNATVTCQANRPLGDTNVANACDKPDGGNGGNNGNNGSNGGNGGNGGNNGGNGGNGGNNGGSNGGN